MSQNPLDRVRRALDPHIRTGSSSREEPTPSGAPVVVVTESPSTNVNASLGSEAGPHDLEGQATAVISTSLSNPPSNFSGFSVDPRDTNVTDIHLTPSLNRGPTLSRHQTPGGPPISTPSGPSTHLIPQGAEGRVGTGTAVGSHILVPTRVRLWLD